MLNCLFAGLGGFAGAALRYLFGRIPLGQPGQFPANTLLINILGAVFIGILSGLFPDGAGANPRLLLFLKVGVCGGFTTFSTFSLESAGLFSQGRILAGVLYVLLSAFLCLAAVYFGKNLGRLLF